MANTKISELTALTTPADADKLVIVDDSEASVEQTKYITHANYQTGVLTHATEIPFTIGTAVQVNIADGKIEPETANDIDLGSSTKEFKNLYLEGSITIDDIAQGKDVTAAIHRKIVEIGDWNMDSNGQVSIAHGLTVTKIRSVVATIRDDTGAEHHTLPIHFTTDGSIVAFISNISASYVVINRITGSYVDGVAYDATSFNRGWIIIDYVD